MARARGALVAVADVPRVHRGVGRAVAGTSRRRTARTRSRRRARRARRHRPRACAGSGRGLRSGPNCSGFTKIDTTTTSASSRARRTRARWPSCSAPMVGTRATDAPAARRSASSVRSSAMVGTVRVRARPRSLATSQRPIGSGLVDRTRTVGQRPAVVPGERVLDGAAHERREHRAGARRRRCPRAGRWPGRRSRSRTRPPCRSPPRRRRGRPRRRRTARRPSRRRAPARSAARARARSPRTRCRQPGEVDARAGERHRRVDRERDRARPERRARARSTPKPRGGVHDELARAARRRRRRAPPRARRARRPGTASSTSSLRSTMLGDRQHRAPRAAWRRRGRGSPRRPRRCR